MHHVWKILSSSGGDQDMIVGADNMAQSVFCCQAAKNVPGANEQDAKHAKAYAAETKASRRET